MCVYSTIGDQYREDFPYRWPTIPVQPWTIPGTKQPHELPHDFAPIQDDLRHCAVCGFFRDYYLHPPIEKAPEVTKEDLDALRKELTALRDLFKAAREFDEATGQRDCEVDEKVEFIRQLCEYLEVDPAEILGEPGE